MHLQKLCHPIIFCFGANQQEEIEKRPNFLVVNATSKQIDCCSHFQGHGEQCSEPPRCASPPLGAARSKNPLHTKHTLHANKLDVSGSFQMLPNLNVLLIQLSLSSQTLDAQNIEASVFNIHSLKPSFSFVVTCYISVRGRTSDVHKPESVRV